jgi:hypothetical protein
VSVTTISSDEWPTFLSKCTRISFFCRAAAARVACVTAASFVLLPPATDAPSVALYLPPRPPSLPRTPHHTTTFTFASSQKMKHQTVGEVGALSGTDTRQQQRRTRGQQRLIVKEPHRERRALPGDDEPGVCRRCCCSCGCRGDASDEKRCGRGVARVGDASPRHAARRRPGDARRAHRHHRGHGRGHRGGELYKSNAVDP